MPPGAGVFSVLPENFFSPLARVNRQHYAALLVLYYRLFQENTRGLERELVIREFMNYLALHRDSLAEEENDEGDGSESAEAAGTAGTGEDSGTLELDFGSPGPSADTENTGGAAGAWPPPSPRSPPQYSTENLRALAGRFLRRLINSGWLGEENLADFTRVIKITAWGKPFFESLARLDEGLKPEYESHVVNVYSSICGEAVKENGHFMVLKAREEARALIDSLKVLSQSIKGYYDKLNAETVRSQAASVLHEHYDLYAGEVLDKAYKRLKTSDNVSRYRQIIFRQVTELLHNEEWLDASAAKYVRILQTSREEALKKLEFMLEELRDDLRSVDPLEDEIDRRNADYSRSSTEIIKAYIEPDSTVAGKLGTVIKALFGGDEELREHFAHRIHRLGFVSPSSLQLRRQREEADFTAPPPKADLEALAQNEAEFFERMRRRLSLKRINAWLDEQGGKERVLFPVELIKDEDSFIRFVYTLLYGDSRNSFDYRIEEDDSKTVTGVAKTAGRTAAGSATVAGSVTAAGYVVPDVRIRRGSPAHSKPGGESGKGAAKGP
jgi:hypothetical protein